jgi:hypothetical protein
VTVRHRSGTPRKPDDGDPGLWHGMTVRRPEGAERLITGRAVGRPGDAAAVATELSKIWQQHLRYQFRSAHTTTTSRDSVTLRAVTQVGPGEIWMTTEVEVALT